MTKPQLETNYKLDYYKQKPLEFFKDIQVTPNIYQSIEDYEANRRFDEDRDEKLQDQP